MKDFLSFRTMITPVVVQILFWVACIASIAIGIYNLVHARYGYAVEIIVLGPIASRLVAESLLVLFGIHRTLLKIEKHVATQDK